MENNVSRVDELIRTFIERHGTEERYINGLEEKFSSWLANADDNDEIKNILIELFASFNFYTKIEIKNILYKQLMNGLHKADLNFTSILPVTKKDGSASSFDIIGLLREIVREHEIRIYKDTILMDISYMPEETDTVILFDDISGTGGTINTFLKERQDYLKGKKIILNLICGTPSAKKEIKKELKKTNLDVDLVVEHEYDKVFSNHATLDETHQASLHQFEEQIWGKRHKNILGFEDSQVLIGFSHNIPNNTISSFWYHPDFRGKRKNWNSLFKRDTLPSRKKSTRKSINLAIKKNKGGR
ncbi:phosphoribosyltransferase-like protein [Priestia megaterium]|uniref:phosphoribosyltransferase-like protein n=1 Tax=Priestia megaterium TaxID=1404 RepID=UPI00298C216B|nr:hypothetical protein [Priestia megaterium]